MQIKRLNQIEGTDREVPFDGGISFRLVLEKDGMGFSVHKTVIPTGGPYHWHYKNHLEACYCIKGTGILKNLETGVEHRISKDVVYLLDQHDNHTFEALEDVVLISIFNPPVKGREVHRKDGSYELQN